MVAITVILAAVIGTFVLNLGGDLQQTPQAQLGVEDASGTSPAAVDTRESILSINHRGGDEIPASDLRILVKEPNSSSETIWDTGTKTNTTVTEGSGSDNVGFTDDPSSLSVGSSETVYIVGATDGSDFKGEWEVQIVHVPSDSIILDQTVNVE